MRKCIITLYCIVLVLTVSFKQSFADDAVFEETVEPFFTALQLGDISALKSYVSGGLFRSITEASEQNEDYGAFLRQRYADATFSPTVKQQDENEMIVSVNVDFAAEGASIFELIIEKDSAGIWRIVDQYSPSEKDLK